MKNKSYRGRAQLRDMGPAGGMYEVDYIIHTFVQSSRHIGASPTTHRVSSADIRPVSGHMLKNGAYLLEHDNAVLCTLRKTGALWEMLPEDHAARNGVTYG